MQKGRSSPGLRSRAMSIELLTRDEGHFLVEVELVGPHAGPGIDTELMLWYQVGRWLEAVPIRRPAEIGRVDVGGQALLEAVKLIRPAEMHLAGKDGPVAGMAQVMGER